ncbi:hypothetical protein G6F50_018058 [Rhizopus delemar]|uniref:Uncharacterized protein n=1 Tax=Rhizopus delemar TaxID=936053 RepID=A0A9P6XNT1_9FUNG|nr:hypothetical protein G6F50_018058 [Rhizopus delemar]
MRRAAGGGGAGQPERGDVQRLPAGLGRHAGAGTRGLHPGPACGTRERAERVVHAGHGCVRPRLPDRAAGDHGDAGGRCDDHRAPAARPSRQPRGRGRARKMMR